MLAALLVLGGFAPLISADFTATLLSGNDGVVTSRFPNSLLLSVPPCDFAGQTVDLEYLNTNTNENKTLTNIFMVPNCTVNTTGSPVLLRNLAYYQLVNLTSGTEYRLRYKVGSVSSNNIMATTRTVSDYSGINEGLPARSGAMVVITVILSLAMFLLLLCLILSTVLSTN